MDGLVGIGRGEGELMIGEGERGKTSVGIDRMLKEKNEDRICIYVGIGEKD